MKQLLKKLIQFLGLYPIIQNWHDKNNRKKIFDAAQKEILFNSQFLKSGDLCFDIGANLGYKTDIYLALGATVICVEPQPQCIKQLQKHFKNNSKVTLLDIGLAEKVGQMELHICDDAPTISTMSTKWKQEGRFASEFSWNKKITVKVDTLDNLIKQYGTPAFCKIDVEGFEESVLKGLTQAIPNISFEFTKEFINDVKKILDHLLTIGQITVNCSFYDNYAFHFDSFVHPDVLFREIASHSNDKLNGDIYVKFDSI